MDNSEFPWFTAKQIDIAGYNALALRMSYAGELGWELHMPRQAVLPIYDVLAMSGARFGMVDYGSFAMNVLRLEKAFKGAAEVDE